MNIFLSRHISEASCFNALIEKGHSLLCKSLLDIEFLPVEIDTGAEMIFFYSINGIKSFFDSNEYNNEVNYGVMGEGSAKCFKDITGKSPLFIGLGRPEEIAEQLLEQVQLKSIHFIKAQQSRDSVMNILSQMNIACTSSVLYNNQTIDQIPSQEFDMLIFTSPLNAKAYFDKRHYDKEILVAIGATTASALESLTGQTASYPQASNEEALCNHVNEMISVYQADK